MKNKIYYIPLTAVLFISSLAGCARKANKEIEKIELSDTSAYVLTGDTFSLTPTLYPETASLNDITWSSEDEKIATVSSEGLVSAISEGTTTIKVSSKLDEDVYATCEVEIDKRDPDEFINDNDVIFTLKAMTGYHYSYNERISVNTYFRSDRLVQLPYISLKEYYRLLLGRDLLVETLENGKYKVTSGNGGIAIIDTNSDTLESDDYQNFITTTIYRQDGVSNVYYDGAPFLRVNRVEEDVTPVKKVINFRKYGINLFGKESDLFLPLVTASNMFMGPTMLTCFYDKNNVYFIDPNGEILSTDQVLYNTEYLTGILSFFHDGKRSDSEAKFSYGQLCFFVDTYYGLPGREYLHELLASSRDLDNTLLNMNELTRKTRSLLMSRKVHEYYAGIYMLSDMLSDAGHSVFDQGMLMTLYMDRALSAKVSETLSAVPYRGGQCAAPRNIDSAYSSALSNARRASGISDFSTINEGDTLIFTFDSFMFDIASWVDYYKNPQENTLPDDAITLFRDLLEICSEDGETKNIVLDISANGGGFGDMVIAMMGLMGKPTYQHSHDMVNNNYTTVYYDFDANFDGVFDEKDKEYKYNFNFAILTSGYSFSCGNMLPLIAKENGIMTIGDKSGGGSCAVLDAITAEGLYIRSSSQDHMTFLNGDEAEFGVDVDYKLVNKNGETYDFSNFFNIEIIGREMNNFYGA